MMDGESFPRACANCAGPKLYATRYGESASGGLGPNLLPGLGRLLLPPRFHVVVCEDCGHTLFFATRETRGRLAKSDQWRRLDGG